MAGLIAMDPRVDADAKVDCGACTACCRRELVMLVEGDDRALYPEAIDIEWQHPFTGAPISTVIPHAADGACIYLGKAGCTIYDKRPKMCRVFSCVGFVQKVLDNTTRSERRRDLSDGSLDREIFDAGMARLKKASAA